MERDQQIKLLQLVIIVDSMFIQTMNGATCKSDDPGPSISMILCFGSTEIIRISCCNVEGWNEIQIKWQGLENIVKRYQIILTSSVTIRTVVEYVIFRLNIRKTICSMIEVSQSVCTLGVGISPSLNMEFMGTTPYTGS